MVTFESRYGVGHEVYTIYNSEIVKGEIIGVLFHCDGMDYKIRLIDKLRADIFEAQAWMVGDTVQSLIRSAARNIK
jgi:hypothetical protein